MPNGFLLLSHLIRLVRCKPEGPLLTSPQVIGPTRGEETGKKPLEGRGERGLPSWGSLSLTTGMQSRNAVRGSRVSEPGKAKLFAANNGMEGFPEEATNICLHVKDGES